MPIIADSGALNTFCRDLRGADFITVDTEFLRDQTYWPKLCLIQIGGSERAVAVDPLAPGIDLGPLADLLHDESLLKVFHSALVSGNRPIWKAATSTSWRGEGAETVPIGVVIGASSPMGYTPPGICNSGGIK